MKKGLIASIATLLTSASLALGQPKANEDNPVTPTTPQQPPATADRASPSPIENPTAGLATESMPVGVEYKGWQMMVGPEASRLWDSDESLLWVSGEALRWWTRRNRGGDPVTTTSNTITGSRRQDGSLGDSGTSVLFNTGSLDVGPAWGGRVTVGYWLDACRTVGIEGSGFLLARQSSGFSVSSNSVGVPFLALPFFDLFLGHEDRFASAEPGLRSGSITVNANSRLWGAEANSIVNVFSGPSLRVNLVTGFRYLDLDENLDILGTRTGINGTGSVFLGQFFRGSTLSLTDRFHTRNQFYGGQIGARAEYRFRNWVAELQAMVGLGDTHQIIDITGTSTLIQAGLPNQTTAGGRFAPPSRLGHFNDDAFSIVPETRIKVGYQFTQNVIAFVGYDFLYWTNVVRPGDQIDRRIDRREVPTDGLFDPTVNVGRQAPAFRHSDFWAQGIDFGLEIRY